MLRPPALRPGDTVYIVAPSSPFDRTLVLRGMGWLAERYHVRFSRQLFQRQGFLAGSDEQRAADLNTGLSAPQVRAIIAARGGYGMTRILSRLQAHRLVAAPRWVVGFSDVTALHLEASRQGVMSLHAEHVSGLGRADAHARGAWLQALEHPEAERTLSAEPWYPGVARGPLVGGNLTVIANALQGRPHSWPLGAVIFMEDVGEASYRIDRALSAIIDSGMLDSASAIVLGHFTDCRPGKFNVSVEHVLRERLSRLRLPMVGRLPVGHARPNAPLFVGAPTQVDGNTGRVTQFPNGSAGVDEPSSKVLNGSLR